MATRMSETATYASGIATVLGWVGWILVAAGSLAVIAGIAAQSDATLMAVALGISGPISGLLLALVSAAVLLLARIETALLPPLKELEMDSSNSSGIAESALDM